MSDTSSHGKPGKTHSATTHLQFVVVLLWCQGIGDDWGKFVFLPAWWLKKFVCQLTRQSTYHLFSILIVWNLTILVKSVWKFQTFFKKHAHFFDWNPVLPWINLKSVFKLPSKSRETTRNRNYKKILYFPFLVFSRAFGCRIESNLTVMGIIFAVRHSHWNNFSLPARLESQTAFAEDAQRNSDLKSPKQCGREEQEETVLKSGYIQSSST